MIDRILERNREFVDSGSYLDYTATKYPKFKTAVISCMDARLVHMLPAALGLEDGDIVLIKNAGGRLTDPFGETMRSLLVGIYELGVEDVVFIGHTDCGAQKISAATMIEDMKARGIAVETIRKLEDEADLDGWLAGFESNEDSVTASVRMLSEHPLIPSDVRIHGFVIDVVTGELTRVL
ncbi:MAG: carbonic anhydrase [Thermoplasmata archaeon]|nr:carbonic anhydrase [Thermoplasmata archaeon]